MKLSEQIKEFQGMLYDDPASAENVRDQVDILARYMIDLAEAAEALTIKLGQIDKSLYRISNDVSCRANGIIPD